MRAHLRAPAILVLALLPLSCQGGSGGPPPRPEVGIAAPAFEGVTMAGDSLGLEDLKGRPVLLNMWATWCAPCRTETPFLESLHKRFGPKGLQVLGVSVDGERNRDGVASFMEEAGVTYPVIHDFDMESMDLFYIIGLPATFILDGEGVFRLIRLGPVSEQDEEFLGMLESLTS